MNSLNKQPTLITGGNSGIGYATGLRFNARGAQVMVTCNHSVTLINTASGKSSHELTLTLS